MSYLGTKIKEFNPGFDETEEQVNKLISPIPRDYTTDGIPLPEDHPSCGYRIMPDGVAVVKDLTDNAGVGYNEITLIKKLEELDLRRAF
ncbi:hypothetical protein Zmor_027051 [Zophobas morio]|uniref:Uncharacterized protein n=1 Tax=Zophobas morio TaxID=2755281 RepID=A0AA38HJP6_9CUCU|nr:hypothetical protein Zmor_027051 [Zophobas morio]